MFRPEKVGRSERFAPNPWCRGYSLLELMVAAGMIALLTSILLPSLSQAREQARSAYCKNNLRQLLLANTYYAQGHQDVYCPGAADFLRNLHRWHGSRKGKHERFVPKGGALTPYLGDHQAIRRCPAFREEQIVSIRGGFERGNGGYGYNNDYVGVYGRESASGVFVVVDDRIGARTDRIHTPAETVMFTDAAFAADGLIEYSFVHARFTPSMPIRRGTPSIHFRHGKQANVAWCDGHVDDREMTFTRANAHYPSDPADFGIGWFGTADDNHFFDLR